VRRFLKHPLSPLAFPLPPSCEAVRANAVRASEVVGSAASVEVLVGAEEQPGGGECLVLVEESVRTGTMVYQPGLPASFSRCAAIATRFRVRAPWVSAGGEGVSSVQADPGFPQPQPQVPLDLVPSTFHTGVLKWSSAWKGVVALDICVSFCEDLLAAASKLVVEALHCWDVA
jgi:hypothetical protein